MMTETADWPLRFTKNISPVFWVPKLARESSLGFLERSSSALSEQICVSEADAPRPGVVGLWVGDPEI